MLRNLLIAFTFLVFTAQSHAQFTISVDPNPVETVGTIADSDIETNVFIKNTSSSEIQLFWRRVVVDAPAEWASYICDENNCYLPTTNECPMNKPNVIGAGQTIDFQLHIQPAGVEGDGQINVEFYEPNDPNTVLDTLIVNFNVGTTTSIKDISKNDIRIFPNPTTDFFQINDGNVAEVTIFNIVGNPVTSFVAFPGKRYDVTDLKDGLYLVRMTDDSQKVLKTVRLSKK